jgi:hypothetical protein
METVGLLSTCRRELLQGWWQPMGVWWVLWFLHHQSRIFWIPPCIYVLSSFYLRFIIKQTSKDLLSKISFEFYVRFYNFNIGTTDDKVLTLMTYTKNIVLFMCTQYCFLIWPSN